MGYEERNHAFKIVRQSLGFPSSSVVKNPPAMQVTWVRSLGWEDPLEKEMATHSGILAWEIPWTEEPGGLQSMGSKESDTTVTNTHTHACRAKVYLSLALLVGELFRK